MGRFRASTQRSFFPWERSGGLFRRTGMYRLRPLLGVVMLGSLIVMVAVRERKQSGVRRTRAVILDVRRGVDAYLAAHKGICPESFRELMSEGWLSVAPVDAWGNPLTLICARREAGNKYRLVSAGPDGLIEGLDRIE